MNRTVGRVARSRGQRTLLSLLLVALSPVAPGADETATWIGAAGDWGTDTNWDGGLVPNNGVQTFDAVIGDATGPVALGLDVAIESLQLGQSDLLLGFHALQLGSDSTVDGMLRLDTGSSILRVDGPVTIGGTGRITLEQNGAALTAAGPGAQLTLGPDVLVVADGASAGGLIEVDIANNGQILAANNATLRFGAVTVDNANGRLSADTPPIDLGGFFFGYAELNGTTILGGTIDGGDAAPGQGGEFFAYNGAVLDGAGMIVENVTIRANDMTMRGSFENNGNIVVEQLYVDGRTEVNGTGGMTFARAFGAELLSANGSPGDVLVVGADQTLGVQAAGNAGTIRTTVENDGIIESAGDLTTAFAVQINRGTVAARPGGTKTYQNASMLNDGASLHADAGGTINFNDSHAILAEGSSLTGDGVISFNLGSTARFVGTVTSDVAALDFAGNTFGLYSHTIEVAGPSTLAGASGVNFTGKGLQILPFTPGPGSTDSLTLAPTQSFTVDGGFSGVEVHVPLTVDGAITVRNGPWRSFAPMTVNGLLESEGDGILEIGDDVGGTGQILGTGSQPVVFNDFVDAQQVDAAVTAGGISVQGVDAHFGAPVDAGATVEVTGGATFTAPVTAGHLQVEGIARFEAALDAGSVGIGFSGDLQAPGVLELGGALTWNGRISGGGTVNASGPADVSFATLHGTTFNAFGDVAIQDELTLADGARFVNHQGQTLSVPNGFALVAPGPCSQAACDGGLVNQGLFDHPTENGVLVVQTPFEQGPAGVAQWQRAVFSERVVLDGTTTADAIEFNAAPDAAPGNPTEVEIRGGGSVARFEFNGNNPAYDHTIGSAETLLADAGISAHGSGLSGGIDLLIRDGAGVQASGDGELRVRRLDVNRATADVAANRLVADSLDILAGSTTVGDGQVGALTARDSTLRVAPGKRFVSAVPTPGTNGLSVENASVEVGEQGSIVWAFGDGTGAANAPHGRVWHSIAPTAQGRHSFLGTGGGNLADLDGDGRDDLVSHNGGAGGGVLSYDKAFLTYRNGAPDGIVFEQASVENALIQVHDNAATRITVSAEPGEAPALQDVDVNLAEGAALFLDVLFNGDQSGTFANRLDVSARPGTRLGLGSGAEFVFPNGGDLNGDGYEDLVTGPYGAYTGAEYVSLGAGLSPGRVEMTGNLAAETFAFEFEFGGLLPGEGYDQLVVDGTLTATDAILDLLLIDGAEDVIGPADVFTLIDTTLGFFGLVQGAASGERLASGDGLGSFQIFYGAGSPFGQNALVATNFQRAAVPLPASVWMLLGAVAMLARAHRRGR
ncbi:MAG: beta strand repeat-containing protein [Gammaproteobacteria bacterium]